jgi:hypothetical protein
MTLKITRALLLSRSTCPTSNGRDLDAWERATTRKTLRAHERELSDSWTRRNTPRRAAWAKQWADRLQREQWASLMAPRAPERRAACS